MGGMIPGPPTSEEDRIARQQGWGKFMEQLGMPGASQTMFDLGTRLMQDRAPGQSNSDALGKALRGTLGQYNVLQQQHRVERRQDEADQMEKDKFDLEKQRAALEASKIGGTLANEAEHNRLYEKWIDTQNRYYQNLALKQSQQTGGANWDDMIKIADASVNARMKSIDDELLKLYENEEPSPEVLSRIEFLKTEKQNIEANRQAMTQQEAANYMAMSRGAPPQYTTLQDRTKILNSPLWGKDPEFTRKGTAFLEQTGGVPEEAKKRAAMLKDTGQPPPSAPTAAPAPPAAPVASSPPIMNPAVQAPVAGAQPDQMAAVRQAIAAGDDVGLRSMPEMTGDPAKLDRILQQLTPAEQAALLQLLGR